MFEARFGAVGERTRGRWLGEIEAWNSNGHWRRVEDHLHLSQMQRFPRVKRGYCDQLAIDESAIGRAAIPNQDRAIIADNLAVDSGHGRMFDGKIVVAPAPQPVDSMPQLDAFDVRLTGFNSQSGHRSPYSEFIGSFSEPIRQRFHVGCRVVAQPAIQL